MCLQHPEKDIHVAGRRWDFEQALVFLARGEAESQMKFRYDEINQFQPARELFDETANYKQQWFGGFNLVLEIDLLGEFIRRRDELQRARGIGRNAIEQFHDRRAQSFSGGVFAQSEEFAHGANAPAAKDFPNFRRGFKRQNRKRFNSRHMRITVRIFTLQNED